MVRCPSLALRLGRRAGRGEKECRRAKKEGALGDRRRAPFSVGKSWCLVLGVDGAGAWSDRTRQGGAASEAGTLTTRWCSPRRVRLDLPGSGKRPLVSSLLFRGSNAGPG